jgi:ProP effector
MNNLMTTTETETPVETGEPAPVMEAQPNAGRTQTVQAVLEKLFELYPHLFGAEFLPLKLGVFQELMTRHPDQFDRAGLKSALGLHTRSTRYLQSVAAGKKRHDLNGNAVEEVAPEHVFLSLLELFKRRQNRTKEDLRPKLRTQLIAAFEASGLPRQEYLARVQSKDENANTLLMEALAEYEQKLAKQEALRSAFQNSGKSVKEFADMYGLNPREVGSMLKPSV